MPNAYLDSTVIMKIESSFTKWQGHAAIQIN